MAAVMAPRPARCPAVELCCNGAQNRAPFTYRRLLQQQRPAGTVAARDGPHLGTAGAPGHPQQLCSWHHGLQWRQRRFGEHPQRRGAAAGTGRAGRRAAGGGRAAAPAGRQLVRLAGKTCNARIACCQDQVARSLPQSTLPLLPPLLHLPRLDGQQVATTAGLWAGGSANASSLAALTHRLAQLRAAGGVNSVRLPFAFDDLRQPPTSAAAGRQPCSQVGRAVRMSQRICMLAAPATPRLVHAAFEMRTVPAAPAACKTRRRLARAPAA